VVGHPLPSECGQQIHTHLLALPEERVIEAFDAEPLMVPGSPEPVSPSVPCQGARMKVLRGVAARGMLPGATHTV
jgi:hypothetical protein